MAMKSFLIKHKSTRSHVGLELNDKLQVCNYKEIPLTFINISIVRG